MDEERNTVFDFIADVLSGRVQNTLEMLHRNQKAQWAVISNLRRDITMAKTQAEQALINASADLKAQAERLQQLFDDINARTQEDLTEEMAEFNASMEAIKNIGKVVDPTDSTGTTTDGPTTPDVSGPAITEPAVETPLAGNSGTTNPPVEGAGPLVDPVAPGQPIAEGEPTGQTETGVEDSGDPSVEPGPAQPASDTVEVPTSNAQQSETGQSSAAGDAPNSQNEPTQGGGAGSW